MKKITLLLSAMLLACATNLWAEDSWVEVSIDQLTSSDVFIIVDATSGCAIPNNPTKQPLAVSIMKDGAWDFTKIADNLKWNITGNNTEGYVISPNGDATKRLYCQNDNKGVRVGTPTGTTYNLFWDANVNKLKQQVSASATRWIGCYNKTDWRCYDSGTATNIKGTVTRFYKLVTVAKTVSVAVAEGQEETGSVAMSYKANSSAPEWTEATEPVVEIAGEGAEVFQFVATPAEGYKFAGWTTTGDITLNSTTAATTEGGLATETSVVTANFERDATLTSLAISGKATKLNYFVGDTFDPAGLVVTATYSDGATDKVTDQVSWTFDPETFDEAGTASVTVTATIDAVSAELTISDIVVVDVDKYALVKNSTLLADGQHIIIVDANKAKALSTTQNKNNRGAVAITIKDELIVDATGVEVITLDSIMDGETVKWKLQVTGGFLYAASNSSNQLKTRETNSDAKGQWTISIKDEVATIKALSTSHNWLRYNSNSNIFSCYDSGENDIAIYARQYTVKVVSNDENMGTVSGDGDGKYFENNVAKLVATPKAGYKLTGWSNNSELTKNEQSLVVTENITITAYFAKGETAIDNAAVETPVIKTIENGQLVILRDGVKYNAMGVRLQ